MKNHQRFLNFNGNNITFLSIDGTYWVALRPILDALNIDADRSIKTLKKDPILGPARSLQTVQVSRNGKKQLRNVTCLPEKFIYGWIFSLRSDSNELYEYKWSCYELLYNHFHGTITSRRELLLERSGLDNEIAVIKQELKEENLMFDKLEKLQVKRKSVNKQLNTIDKELIKQPDLFGSE